MSVGANVFCAGGFEHFPGGISHILNQSPLVFTVGHMDLENRNPVDVFDVGVQLDEIVPARQDFAKARDSDSRARFEQSFLVSFAEAGRAPIEPHGGFAFVAVAPDEFLVRRSVRQIAETSARFRNLPNAPPYKKFIRGYGYEGESTMRFNWGAPGFGEAYKKALLEPRSSIQITGFGEVLPRWDNFVELDPNVKDIYGIPVLKIHMSDGENERAMIQDMGESAGEMLEAAGAKSILTYAHPSAPRWALHEAGIARMGADPKKSVLNQFQQTHDIKNLFVMDASGFPSNPCQNPTLTIMALCVRSCDYLMAELKRNSL